jgi:hypothetical protein
MTSTSLPEMGRTRPRDRRVALGSASGVPSATQQSHADTGGMER